MKNYNLKFGLQYKNNTWHVIKKDKPYFVAYCNINILMGHLVYAYGPDYYIYPIKELIKVGYNINKQLSFNNICHKCKKKFKVTQEDINHYIVLAKLKVKI